MHSLPLATTHLLLRPGELFLKGGNYGFFMQRLARNIELMVGKKPSCQVRGRLLFSFFSDHRALSRVFGLVSYSPAVRVEKTKEAIQKAALSLLQGKQGPFRIITNRSDKTFSLKSPELNKMVGAFIEEHSPLRFARDAQLILEIEINRDGAYLFTETIPCGGGLPTGVEGKVLLVLEDESSILAGILMMKRGCGIIPVGYQEKDLSLLLLFHPTPLSLSVIEKIQGMEEIARKHKAMALVVGQMLDTLHEVPVSLPVLRPLIGYTSSQINVELEKYKRMVNT